RVLDNHLIVLLYSILGIGFAVYFGAFEKDAHTFRKSTAIIIFIYSVALFIGVLGGSSSMTRPLEFLKPSVTTTSDSAKHLKFEKVTSIKELNKVLEANRGKKIMLDFTAEWCAICKELDKKTFSDETVKAKLGEFVLIAADITQNNKEQKELSKKYGVFGPPVLIFFDKELNVIESKTIVGFIEPKEFLENIKSM
ncbi:MAG: thioredoxin fold domain-containing protein, partial [Sulfurimonas sp.]|nr:thioredoxin fold domain-containing protein [Sulfurimonas sp.]